MDALHTAAAEVAARILATTGPDEKHKKEDSRVFQDLQQMALVILRQSHVN